MPIATFLLFPSQQNSVKGLSILAYPVSLLFPLESTPVRLPFSRPPELLPVTSLGLSPLFQLLTGFLDSSLSNIQSLSKSYQLCYQHISVITTFPCSKPHYFFSGLLYEPLTVLLASTLALL